MLRKTSRVPLNLLSIGLGCAALVSVVPSATSPACAQSQAPAQAFQFENVGRSAGVLPAVSGIQGHAAGWGDVDGNGFPDLYVGTFHDAGPANQLLLNQDGQFRLSDNKAVQISTRASAALFVDLDNDGDLDLYVSSMPVAAGSKAAERQGRTMNGCTLFRNDGGGNFVDVSKNNAACPPAFGGRSACALDYDGDGLLDLLVGEDPLPGYNGSATNSSRLFRNQGDLKFADVSREVGLPEGVAGLGVAAADVNNDGWPDFFIASHVGGNRLFINNRQGKFTELPGSQELFHWPDATGDNMICGVCFGDVNRDGLHDLVLGQHFKRPWLEPVANRLYLNRGLKGGMPQFEDVTEQVGLEPLPMKAPHVELQDFDNDGWPDLYTSIVKFAGDRPYPLIYQHQGLKGDLPQFKQTALSVNDFPNESDKAQTRTTQFFNKMIADGQIIYMAPGPSADFDRDGRRDLFLANWWIESPSLLLRNETPSGNYLDVQVEGAGKLNRQGIGCRINIYPAGKLGDAASLIGSREIAAGFGYASAPEVLAHLGLGKLETCDLELILPHNGGRIEKRDVKANQLLTIEARPR